MTSQIPDTLVVDGVPHEIVDVKGTGLFDPAAHFQPEMISTACGRGYICTYAVAEGQLVLQHLALQGRTPEGETIVDGTALLGGTVHAGQSRGALDLNIDIAVPFSGRMLVGDTWLPELYEHLGYLPAWKYLRVLEIAVIEGTVHLLDDVSDEIAELRRGILAGEVGERAERSLLRTDHRVGAFAARERAKAIAWKHSSDVLPDEARGPAPYMRDGKAGRTAYDFCLPAWDAELNLLPEVGAEALRLFSALEIPWHAGIAEGPSNHLLDSQVQCVNALGQMVADPSRVTAAFSSVLDIAEVLEIEPDRHLTFEFIGPDNFFAEGRGGKRVRGAGCTSVDAAFLCRSRGGDRELVLAEWKYTESYAAAPDHRGDDTRTRRWGPFLADPDGPIDGTLMPLPRYFDEPFYQLVRQQLLADQLERSHALGADRVRVVHVLSPRNVAYQRSVHHDEQRALGTSASAIWNQLLRRRDRFTTLDPAVFLDPEITSAEYVSRYR